MSGIPLSPLFKIYVWSIILEPMLYFVIGERSVTGVTANVSRILQTVVVLWLLIGFVASSVDLRQASPFGRIYINYTIYFLLACIAGVYGYLRGAYTIPVAYGTDVSAFAGILNSAWLRPLFEYFIAIYYFVYFVVLPRYFLKKPEHVEYYFKWFFRLFGASLLIGFIGYLLSWFDIVLVGRHMFDRREIGHRFNGLAGEPRDAFVYLIFGVALYYLRCYQTGAKVNVRWLAVVGAAALLTQSASGLLGIVIFLGLLIALGLVRLNKFALGAAFVLPLMLVPLLIVLVENSERLLAYRQALLLTWSILENHEQLPLILIGNSNNIYPAYEWINKLREFDLAPVLIGSGIGSASAINNLLGSWDELTNPNSQLIRLIYESGLVGSFFFVMAFYRPMELLTAQMSRRHRRVMLALTVLLIGAFLAHRSASLYIFLGIAIATLGNARSAVRRLEPRRVPAASSAVAARP